MAAETDKQRKTAVQTETEWEESPGVWINLSVQHVCVRACVLGTLIKTLLHDRGRRQAAFSLLMPLPEIMERWGLKWNLCFWARTPTSIRTQQPAICVEWGNLTDKNSSLRRAASLLLL